jgi:effector-binding domain-containing protein
MADGSVTLVQVQPRRTAVIADTVAWADFPDLWRPMLDEVYEFARRCPQFAAALAGVPGPHWQNVMLYRDGAPNVEVGVLAPSSFVAQGRVIESQLPGGHAATAVHHGNPAQIGQTHDAVREFLSVRGLRGTGTVWEIYGHPGPSGNLDTEVYHHVGA